MRYEFWMAILPSLKVKRSQPFTSMRLLFLCLSVSAPGLFASLKHYGTAYRQTVGLYREWPGAQVCV